MKKMKVFIVINKKECQTICIVQHSFVIPLRFERRTHALEGRCSIQLSYGTILNCDAKVCLFFFMCKHF